MHPIYCTCGAIVAYVAYRPVPTGRTNLAHFKDVDWTAACFGARCTRKGCGTINEHTFAVDLTLAPVLILKSTPYLYVAHAVLADRWRAGALTEGPSFRLLWAWNAVFGIPDVVDHQLTVHALANPPARKGLPQVWPNGKTDGQMPGAGPDLDGGHLG